MLLLVSEQILTYFPLKYHSQVEVKSFSHGAVLESSYESQPLPFQTVLPYPGLSLSTNSQAFFPFTGVIQACPPHSEAWHLQLWQHNLL